MDGDGLWEARNPTTGKTRPGSETKCGRCSGNSTSDSVSPAGKMWHFVDRAPTGIR